MTDQSPSSIAPTASDDLQRAVGSLLDRFVDAASGERTPATRARYERALGPLRVQPSTEHGVAGLTAAVALLDRIAPALRALEADPGRAPEVAVTVPSLWARLVTWVARTAPDGELDPCAAREARACLRRSSLLARPPRPVTDWRTSWVDDLVADPPCRPDVGPGSRPGHGSGHGSDHGSGLDGAAGTVLAFRPRR